MCRTCEYGVKRTPERQALWRQQYKARQATTVDTAHRAGQPYTDADIAVAEDMSKSNFQVAVELGRTLFAIGILRHKMGVNPRKSSDAGNWIIDFPNAMKALQEHYRELGVVPESEWEWNDG